MTDFIFVRQGQSKANDPGRLDDEIRGMIVSNGHFHDHLLAALKPGWSQK